MRKRILTGLLTATMAFSLAAGSTAGHVYAAANGIGQERNSTEEISN